MACITCLGLLAFVLLARASDTPTASTLSYARIVRLSYVEGDVQIVRADKSSKWEPAAMNMPIEQGFAIGTNVGRAEVEFENGTMLWLAPNSVVQFTELALSSGGRITRITLSEGLASFDADVSPGETFEVSTSNFNVTPSKNAEFKVAVRDRSAGVSVMDGKVLVGDHGSMQDVAKGAMFVDQTGKTTKTAMVRSPKPDQWDRWVSDRLTAERYGATQAMVNANAPFSYGMSDLADYGAWNYYPGFGYGWQPFGMMAGWAPFMDGNWMYYPTFGWTWISAEPWGWVPYHFGGWQYSSVYGWMWFPGNYGTWTAAPVQWLGVGKHIGWTPRAVSVPHAGEITAPVIVSTSKLGHEGRNRVFSASELSAKMQKLNIHTINFAPAENGKPLPMNAVQSRRLPVIVPTSASLQALRAHLASNASTRININSLHPAAMSRTPIQAIPERGFAPVNAAIAAPRMPSRPPMHVAFGPPDMTAPYSAGRASAMPGLTTTPPATSPSTPATTARTTGTTTASAPGRPR
ncbi:MAG TPA: FecR family protein [Candidatus Acidoferrum sp.]|nr:FecR family protein [Candidatus Acidoferrum sp.]